MEAGFDIRRPFRRVGIRTRVALFAALLAVVCLGSVGFTQLRSQGAALTGATEEQAYTMTTQLSRATAGAGGDVIAAIPFSSNGLDGVVMVDDKGNVLGSGGALAGPLKGLRARAAEVARSGEPVLEFRELDGRGVGRAYETLSPASELDSIQVAIVAHDGGAIMTGYHVDWAVKRLRRSAVNSGLSLAGGALFLCFALVLVLGRLITRPLGQLASEVRRLGEGNLVTHLSPQRSPEMRQLAAGISQMRDDLLHAEKQSSTDPLTGIANHRAFHERLGLAVEESQRQSAPLALIALDVDNLKAINDRFGHVAGDRVIEAVARQIAAGSRESDLCARVGGDEFAVICPGADRHSAGAVAERMAASVRALEMTELVGREAAGVGLAVSISVGVSDMPANARSKDELIVRADAAMYQAKGRRNPAEQASVTSAAPAAAPAHAAPEPSRLLHTVRALALAVDAKDSGTRSHCETVAELSVAIGRELGVEGDGLEGLRRAALLHDVGKIGTPDSILRKPAPLSAAELDEMRRHSALGYRILLGGGLPEREAIWVLHHHEHMDGSGYPHGLKGEEIPLQSRILRTAEAFEAMTSERPYSEAIPASEALAELRRCAGRQFDARAVEALALVLERSGRPERVAA